MAKRFEFEIVKQELIKLSKELGRIPTQAEIQANPNLPHCLKYLHYTFKENEKLGYIDYLKSFGYELKQAAKLSNLTYEQLCSIWEHFYKKHGKYPNSVICSSNKYDNIPKWHTVKKICGDRYLEFTEKYGLRDIVKTKSYEEYCNKFIEISNDLGRPLKIEEFSKKNDKYTNVLPNYRWFLDHCPDKTVKNYNQFLLYLGFKPRYDIPKEYAVEAIMKKYQELKRPLKMSDFTNPSSEEIGRGVIDVYWGNFNNMLRDLGLPITQENMTEKQKNIEELQQDIMKMCNHIKETEGRVVINQREDIKNYDWCSSIGTYTKLFKKHLGMTINDFIISIGFTPTESGHGMKHSFDDGEVTTSKYEFTFSSYLRKCGLKYNINYQRNVPYSDLIDYYQGKMNCDYVINIKNTNLIIEIAGMMRFYEKEYRCNQVIQKSSSKEKYRVKLLEKEQMLKNSKYAYRIIMPSDFKNDVYKEIMSEFLFNNQKIA